MKTRMFACVLAVLGLGPGCGDLLDDITPDDGDGPCSASKASLPCGSDCAFDPDGIDCSVACQHVADLCANNDCEAQCQSVNQDVQQCTNACQGTKGMYCTNITFGCYQAHTDCTGVGNCVNDKL